MIKNKIVRTLCFSLAAVSALIVMTQLTVYGKNQAANEVNQTENYTYGIGSVSKMYCTAAVMKLVDEKKIDLDTPLVNYIPDFSMSDERYKKITPKMLLDHSSGIMGTTSHNGFVYGDGDTRFHDTFLEQLKKQTLKADPGEYSVYCNDGFMLAEILVERVSGMSFSEYIKKEFSEPLGLEHTFTPRDGVAEATMAPVYFGDYTLPYVNCQFLGSGGIYSTAEDMCKFSQIFMQKGNKILSKASVDMMAKAWYLEDKIGVSEGDTQVGYGLGWDCVNAYPYNRYNIKALMKGGDVNGYHSNLTVLPEQNLSVAITASGGSSTYCQEVAQDILLEVLKEEGIIDEIKNISINNNEADKAPLPEEMKQYEGYYASQNMLKVEFDKDDRLLLKPIGSDYDTVQEYVYTKSGEFVSTNGYYISGTGDLVSNANGNKGLTRFRFSKQPNGKTYMLGTIYESTMSLGESAYTLPLAEKIEPATIDEKTMNAWKKRKGKNFFLIDEVFNSSAFLEHPIMEIRLFDEIPGYAYGHVNVTGTKGLQIVDSDTAKCEMDLPGIIGRDLIDFKFSTNNKTEYLSSDSYRYEGNEAVKASSELPEVYEVTAEDSAVWYEVRTEDAGKELEITAPNNGAYYVYNKDNICISSSLFKDNTGSVVLPERGHLVLTGKKGAVFSISR